MEEVENALVICWDATDVYVKCPFCDRTHRHGLADGLKRGQNRLSHCNESVQGHYEFVFPSNDGIFEGAYGWEIDKEEVKVYTVNERGRLYVPEPQVTAFRRCKKELDNLHVEDVNEVDDSVDELVDRTCALNVSDSGALEYLGENLDREAWNKWWKKQLENPVYRKTCYIAACVTRDLPQLSSLFSHYPMDGFSHAIDNEGNNGILLASTEEDGLETVKWLQQRGVELDKSNHFGRTPLMEAALWGRVETVRYLVSQNVNIDICDNNELSALELAKESSRNEDERNSRSAQVYREKADARMNRRAIALLLTRRSKKSVKSFETKNLQEYQDTGYFKREQNGDLLFYEPSDLYTIPHGQEQKAFARLHRAAGYEVVAAMSGYSSPQWPNVLNNAEWSQRAHKLCALIGHDTTLSFASHVEKQLVTYYLAKHTIFAPQNELGREIERQRVAEIEKKQDLVTEYEWDEHSQLCEILEKEKDRLSKLQALEKVIPKAWPGPAAIVINKDRVCRDCYAFLDLVKDHFGLSFQIRCVGDQISPNGTK